MVVLSFPEEVRLTAYMKNLVEYRTFRSPENTTRIMNDTFWLGFYPGLSEEIMEYILEVSTSS